ncbi:MAG: hypothetical protein ACKV2U_25480 [Bryobacteraceae bacterium]
MNAISLGWIQLARADARVVGVENHNWIVPIDVVFEFTSMGGSGPLDDKFFQRPGSKPFLLAHLLNHDDLAIFQIVQLQELEEAYVAMQDIQADHGITVNLGCAKSGSGHSDTAHEAVSHPVIQAGRQL